MEKPLNLSFLKDRYDWELARKDSLTSSLTLPVGVLTGLGSLVAVMVQSFSFQDGTLAWFFTRLVFLDALAFLTGLVFFALAYHGQKYGYMPRLGELREGEAMLVAYFTASGEDESLAHDELTRQLESRIIDAADKSALSNDRRTAFLHRANIALFSVLVLTFLAGIVYILDQVRF